MLGANQIIFALEKEGFEAYIIGGAVRDILLDKEPKDFDIVTNAYPEQVIETMSKNNISCTDIVGQAFGVIVASNEFGQYEIATFRSERYGMDSHRPEEITYAKTLEEDVKRRDFTVNGLAMDSYGNIVDYVDGRKDLKKKVLRTIGSPKERFYEDALRLFRICRFSAQLGFDVAKKTQDAMPKAFGRVSGLSLERIKIELEKTLQSAFVAKGLDLMVQSGLAEQKCRIVEKGKEKYIDILPELRYLVDLPQAPEFHAHDAWRHTLVAVQNVENTLVMRWGALLHDVAKGLDGIRGVHNNRYTDRGHDSEGAIIAKKLLKRLRYNDKFAERVAWIVKNHMRFHFFVANEEANAVKWIRKEARSGIFRTNNELKEAFEQLTAVCVADVIACGKEYSSTEGTIAFGKYLQEKLENMPVHTRDLKYSQELIEISGDKTRYVLAHLLQQVQDGHVINNEKDLLVVAKKWLIKHKDN